LHDFCYEEARPQFERILKADPACAMAHWGIALSVFHQIWDQPDAAAQEKDVPVMDTTSEFGQDGSFA
jgi:hypothetical protein